MIGKTELEFSKVWKKPVEKFPTVGKCAILMAVFFKELYGKS